MTYIIDTLRYKRHQDYDILAQVVTGEGLGNYVSMTDLDSDSGPKSSRPGTTDLDSEFVISSLPIGLGYVTE